MLVTLDTLTAGGMFDGRFPTIDGVEYVVTKLTGWWSSPKLRSQRTAKQGAPGSYRGPAYSDERSIQLDVTATSVYRSAKTMRDVEQRLGALCSDPDALFPMTVEDQLGATRCHVERDGDVLVDFRDGLRWSSTFSFTVAAPDPRRASPRWTTTATSGYGVGIGGVVSVAPGVDSADPAVLSGQAATVPTVIVAARGTAPSVPQVVEIVGPVGDVTVLVDGGAQAIGMRGVLAAGQSLWINTDGALAHDVPVLGTPAALDPIADHGAVYVDGTNARSSVWMRGGWPRLAPGVTRTFQLSGQLGVGAALRVHTRDAFA